MPDANLFQKRDVIRERMAQDKALLKEVKIKLKVDTLRLQGHNCMRRVRTLERLRLLRMTRA